MKCHLRHILEQFWTGSHWLHIEIGRHTEPDKMVDRPSMCGHSCVYPGSPAALDGFDQVEGRLEEKTTSGLLQAMDFLAGQGRAGGLGWCQYSCRVPARPHEKGNVKLLVRACCMRLARRTVEIAKGIAATVAGCSHMSSPKRTQTAVGISQCSHSRLQTESGG